MTILTLFWEILVEMAQRPPSKLKLPSTRSQTQSGAPGRPSGLRPPASIRKNDQF